MQFSYKDDLSRCSLRWQGQPLRKEGICLAQQDAGGGASTGESLNEVVARGDTGVVLVPASLDTEGGEIWHGPHRHISLSTACLELILPLLSPTQKDGLLLTAVPHCCRVRQRNGLI